jgi:two-component system OmpR family sensor kinase
MVRGDASQLHQVLVNPLSNARKHAGAGTTAVTGVSRSADGGVAVTVTDDGAGIPAEFVDRVFTRFACADAFRAVRVPSGEGAAAPGSAGQASAEGTSGLGLSIVQSIVEAMGVLWT